VQYRWAIEAYNVVGPGGYLVGGVAALEKQFWELQWWNWAISYCAFIYPKTK